MQVARASLALAAPTTSAEQMPSVVNKETDGAEAKRRFVL
jgi:hypothetical protein